MSATATTRELPAVDQGHHPGGPSQPAPQVEPDQPRNVRRGRPAGHLLGCPVLHDPAVLDDHQPVGEHHRLERSTELEQEMQDLQGPVRAVRNSVLVGPPGRPQGVPQQR